MPSNPSPKDDKLAAEANARLMANRHASGSHSSKAPSSDEGEWECRVNAFAATVKPHQSTTDELLAEAERKAREVDNVLAKAGVGRRYIRERLDTYRAETERQRRAMAWATDYCARSRAKDGDGVLLIGEPGCGKTHILCGILREYAAQGTSICYVTVEDFFIALQSTFGANGRTEDDVLARFATPSVLILDDLHHIKNAEHDWQYKRLWTLLDRRYRDLRATLVSTNRSLDDFTDMIDARTRRRIEAEVFAL